MHCLLSIVENDIFRPHFINGYLSGETMIRASAVAVCLGLIMVLMFCAPSVSAEPKMVKVLDGIYVYVGGEGVDSNSTAIVTKEGVVIIDTRVSPIEANKLLAAIRQLTDQPVRYVINTHYHGDHTLGNQVFKDTAVIIAHKNVRASLGDENGRKHLDFFKTRNLPGLDEVRITLPNIVYEDKLELVTGGTRLRLIHIGRGHTDGDTAVFLPERRTLIAGDLISNKVIPYLADAYVDDWIVFLSELEKFDAEIIVGGHGDVGDKPMLIHMKHYLMDLRNNVESQLAGKKTLQETKDTVLPVLQGKYGDWAKLDRLDANIERAYQEYKMKRK